jgi:hypothetical protein
LLPHLLLDLRVVHDHAHHGVVEEQKQDADHAQAGHDEMENA